MSPLPPRPRRYLEPEELQRLGNLRLVARRIVEGTFAGRHRSKARGSSVEFADYREYAPGDDLRRLDWKALARTGRPFLRTYDDETSLGCVFVLDTSASMDFPAAWPDSKLTYGRRLAAALAHLVIRARDRAGLALGGDRLESWLEPRSGRGHLDELLHHLERATPVPRTDLGALLEGLSLLLRRRSLVVLCSDFLGTPLDRLFQAVRVLRHRRFELILLHLLHPQERDLPPGAAYRFVDPEGPLAVEASPREIAEGYRDRLDGFLGNLRLRALGAGCDYVRIDTDTPYVDALRRSLRAREAR